MAEVRELLHLPVKSRLTVTQDESARATRRLGAKLSKGPAQVDAGAEDDAAQSRQEIRESEEEKIRMIDARLPDYKSAIQEALSESGAPFAVYIVDDFYLINPQHHAEVIDYLHCLLRDTDLYLKIGTIRHRTRLSKTQGVSYGVQSYQDVDTFDLDRTLEDLGQTSMYLEEMLRKLGQEVGIDDVTTIMSETPKRIWCCSRAASRATTSTSSSTASAGRGTSAAAVRVTPTASARQPRR